MKIISIIFIFGLGVTGLHSEVIRRELPPSTDKSDAVNTVWERNGVEVATQTREREGVSMCIITPFDLEQGRAALILHFRNGRLSSVASGPALNGYSFAIDDFTKDGIPDFIQIVDPESNKVAEAYIIVRGRVEPLKTSLFTENREEFYFDEHIVEYVKRRMAEQIGDANAVKPPGVEREP